MSIAKLLAFFVSARHQDKHWLNKQGKKKGLFTLFWSGPTSKCAQGLLEFQLEEWQKWGRLYCRKGDQARAPSFYCILLSHWLHIWDVGGGSRLDICLYGLAVLEMDEVGDPLGQLFCYLKYWDRWTATHCKRRDLNPHFPNELVRTKWLQ